MFLFLMTAKKITTKTKKSMKKMTGSQIIPAAAMKSDIIINIF